tara:strand:- start:3564 stop:4613 length:1050 start_codon:yes stop_codon:yes gene_type:complete
MDPINDLYQIIFISIFLTFGKFIYTIFDIGSEHFPLIKNFRPRLSSKETIYLTNKLIKDEDDERNNLDKLYNFNKIYMVLNLEKKNTFISKRAEKDYRRIFDFILQFLDNYLDKDSLTILEKKDKLIIIVDSNTTKDILYNISFFNYNNYNNILKKKISNIYNRGVKGKKTYLSSLFNFFNNQENNNDIIPDIDTNTLLKERKKADNNLFNLQYIFNLGPLEQSRFIDFLILFSKAKTNILFISHEYYNVVETIHKLFSACEGFDVSDIFINNNNNYFKYKISPYKIKVFKHILLFVNINLYFSKSNIDYKIVNILLNYNKKILKVEKKEKTENDYFVFNFPNNETFID